MSTSVLYAGSNSPITTVVAGTIIPFNSVVRRYGKSLNISGGNVVVNSEGYYSGIVNITYEGSGAGTVEFSVYKDGVEIPFANASATTAADVINAVAIPFRIREKCCCESTITVVASGAVVDVTNSAISIEKD